MKLAVLGSGSRGNALALTARGRALLVDAGFGLRSLVRRARAVGVPLEALDGIVLTHEHGDHARGAAALARVAGCQIYASPGTLRVLNARLAGVGTTAITDHGVRVNIGPFGVTVCRTSHDAAEPLAVAVDAEDRRVGIAYDLGRPSTALRDLLRECGCLVVEANHDEAMLRTGPYPVSVQRRIAGQGGHLSNRAAAALVSELYHEALAAVVLAHVSHQCNRPALAASAMREALRRRGFRGRLLVARQRTPLAPFEVGAVGQMRLL